MNILIIGSNGFLAKNLIYRLKYTKHNLIHYLKKEGINNLKKKIVKSDIIFYLAGVNRVKSDKDYETNVTLTKEIIDILKLSKKKKKIIFSSSIQAIRKNSYGKSKKNSEKLLLQLAKNKNLKLVIFRLPNIFGKWSKPHYNSVVATFCHQLARKKKIIINSNKKIKLLYIDDLIDEFMNEIKEKKSSILRYPKNSFEISLKQLANILKSFKESVNNIDFEFNNKIIKYLYSTYLSHVPNSKISSELKLYSDDRGSFIELFKNKYSGQISFFTIKPKKVRGNHFHNTKTEKFLLLSGTARVNFLNISDKKKYSIIVNDKKPKIFITKPGYAHNIINTGNKDAKFIVWSNELFDKNKPDTYKYKI
ncbi:NAD-dependent epimerase/dehydratase family protein [Candidatus Pelagibacter communis]|uniref:polysaccharide biosynthesis C-terminal domain-containing protein n=1 Tax=Pelagibacter ubique TaxID=198252 RepID=UPI00094D785E|nr:NAD-dependent epimerase/dehydratase family protein [Candidatus Pelagibacter ubique]